MMNKILIVEDEFSISNFMKTVLEGDGYTVEVATCAAQARAALEKMEFSAMLLDLGLPDADGLELLRELRQRYGLPVIVVSARTEESEKVAALDSGADDYITKPFGSPELLARIRAALRRAGPAANLSAFTTGELTIDYDKHLVTLAGQPVHLTANEYRLVELLSRSAGKVVHLRHIRRIGQGAHLRSHQRGHVGRCRRRQQPAAAGQYGQYPPQAGAEPRRAAVYPHRDRCGLPHEGAGLTSKTKPPTQSG